MARKKERNWSIVVLGLLLIFFGGLCVFYPGLTLMTVTMIAGVGFVFAGLVNMFSYYRERRLLKLSGWYVVFGLLDIFIGAMLLIHPRATSFVLPWLIGSFIVAYAVVELMAIIGMRKRIGKMWIAGVVSAALSLFVGLMFFLYPGMLVLFIAIFAGIRGVSLIAAGLTGYHPV